MGSASGRILRAEGARSARRRRGSTRPASCSRASGRHFDRGSEEKAAGRYLAEEEIAGTTGAAGFYRRGGARRARRSRPATSTPTSSSTARTPTSPGGCGGSAGSASTSPTPSPRTGGATCPRGGARCPWLANFHSVKNRFLLRINNQTAGEFFATLVPTLVRDLVVLGACLTVERSSLPAFGWLWRNRQRLWAKRREIQAKVRARRNDSELRAESSIADS